MSSFVVAATGADFRTAVVIREAGIQITSATGRSRLTFSVAANGVIAAIRFNIARFGDIPATAKPGRDAWLAVAAMLGNVAIAIDSAAAWRALVVDAEC